MIGDEDENFDGNEADFIPGDNDKVEPPNPLTTPAPGNLSIIPASGGDVPNTLPPRLP